MTVHFPFDNSYARLPDRFYAQQRPTPVAAPRLLALNEPLAGLLDLDAEELRSPAGIAVLAGNAVPDGADPLAQAYAGHQFGGWVPQLGDGRAILLGEVTGRDGLRRDIQLKGSGRTPFSRMGDGRAWLGPVLREYAVSEAMHALGIPTTRALAAVATGEKVQRESALPGAVLTRVARSHIRVGTFQFFAARQDVEALEMLRDHVIARHYPEAEDALGLLDHVVAAQARLIAAWLSVGFVHGVMNTDNMSVAGETIDYGPCAFVDAYHPETVFSSIDRQGRYAYNRQPDAAAWNLAQLATALLPLMPGDRETAIEKATASIHRFAPLLQKAWLERFRVKLGLHPTGTDGAPRGMAEDDRSLAGPQDRADASLIQRLLDIMAAGGSDFTRAFRALAEDPEAACEEFADRDAYAAWREAWQNRLAEQEEEPDVPRGRMLGANPAIIPRNHRIAQAIDAAVAGDLAPFERLNAALARPFDPAPEYDDLRRPPAEDEIVRRTFCGT